MSRQPWTPGRLALVVLLALALALILAAMAHRADATQADCESVQVTDQGVLCQVDGQQLDLTIR